MDFSLKTDYSFIFIIVALILSFIISYIYYKKSKLDGVQKKIFTALRFLSTLFILLLLSSPVISFVKNLTQDPVNVFLIDNSESLILENRSENIQEVLNDKIKNSVSDNSENLFFLYSRNLYKEIDVSRDEAESIPFTGINNFETNITASMYSLQERLSNSNLSSVTIISDGIINEGGNPITVTKSLNVPLNYILVGDTIQKNDLVLRNVFYNKTSFIESSVPVNIEVNSYNYEANIKINLYEEDILIDSKDLAVSKIRNAYDVSFNVLSNAEKVVKYKIEIAGLDDEIILRNNYQEFFIKFVNNKFKVLVLAGGPGADLAFISEEIKKVTNFETTFLTQKSHTEFYEGILPDLSKFDTYIFIEFPTSITNQSILNEIKGQIEKNNSSLIFFAGRNTDYSKLSLLDEKLPFKSSGVSGNEQETGITSVNNLNDEIFKNKNLISSVNSLPNIFKTGSPFSINPSAETFLLTTKNSEPAFVIQNTDKNKSAAFLAHGLFKWRLSRQENNAGEVLNYILTSAIVAITDKEEKKTFIIETTKPVYSKYENVKFEAHITNFELQGDEQIKVSLKGSGFSEDIQLKKSDNKYYEGEINIPVNGNYEYTAGLYSKKNLVEDISNRFAIGENNNEFKLTKADNAILNALSNETNGENFTGLNSEEIDKTLNGFNEKSKVEYSSVQNFEMNLNPYYLGMVIFLLCLEWFFRKRNNLP
ncbi:MAG: hypothetical protein M3R36_07545 [Bacteroidota bacterium]|nr:hypothetical protein [Bacteroidota bacterium]